MSALEVSLDDVDYLIRVRRKAGLEPVLHYPRDDDPLSPRCGANHAKRGYVVADVPLDEVDESRICGTCSSSRLGGGRNIFAYNILSREDITTWEDARRAARKRRIDGGKA